jgi:hypothetical protein
VPGRIRTRLYANLARSAGVLGFREVESWAAARADRSWRSGLEEHVVRGDVVRLFLRGAEGSIKEDDFLPLFRADNPTHPSIFAVARLAAYEYAAAASEAPSHLAYLRKGYQDQFESFCRKIGVRVVPEPAPKSAQPYLREHVMKGGTYVEAPLDTILFDLTDQCAPGIGLVFIVHEVALASTRSRLNYRLTSIWRRQSRDYAGRRNAASRCMPRGLRETASISPWSGREQESAWGSWKGTTGLIVRSL